MKLLALDSATEACSAALYIDGRLSERFELVPRQHAARLLPMARQLLAEAGISLSALDCLAFAHGPGSFTGLRIATGAVQGLALGLDRPVIGISTLAALAARTLNRRQASQVAVAMDARMGQVYWGVYGRSPEGHCIALADDSLRFPGQIPALVPDQWQAAGTGWMRHAQDLASATGLVPRMEEIELYPHAEDVARLAVEHAGRGEGVPAALAQPLYLREQVAEKMPGKR